MNHHPYPGEFKWTEENVVELKRLFDAGEWSCGQIAQMIGCTRNAVIGKLHRMGLERSLDDVAQRKSDGAAKRSKMRRPAAASNNFAGVNARKRAEKAEIVPQLEAGEPIDIAPDQSEHAVSLFDVRGDQCRWPLNDAGPGFLFCGAKQEDGCSYCTRHHMIARGSGTRSERNAVKDFGTMKALEA